MYDRKYKIYGFLRNIDPQICTVYDTDTFIAKTLELYKSIAPGSVIPEALVPLPK